MYKIIDLFCGVGGFSYGFEATHKFKTVVGIDFWDVALETFKYNHGYSKVINDDIKNLQYNELKEYIGKVDVIIAGPPCQGFSMSGKRDKMDKRNNLFEEVIRIVSIVKPKVVVIENVVGLLSMSTVSGDRVQDVIVNKLRNLEYHVEQQILTASEYGVPQNRKRVIFIASQLNNVKFPEKQYGDEKKPLVTVGDAIGNIPENGGKYLKVQNEYQKEMKGKTHILNHEAITHSDIIKERMRHVPQGGNWKNIPIELGQGGGKHSNNYRRLKNDEPSITIKHASKSMIIHPLYDRTPTIREIARIQSFDDNFEFKGTKYEQHQQLANAVPPLLGKAIAETILEILGDYDD